MVYGYVLFTPKHESVNVSDKYATLEYKLKFATKYSDVTTTKTVRCIFERPLNGGNK